MKKLFFTTLLAIVAAGSLVAAEATAKLSGVHLCCQSCVKGVEKAAAEVKGLTVAVDQDSETVSLTGPDTATIQKGADALVGAGYFGKSSDAAVKVSATTGAAGKKVQSLKVEGVHLCCGKCVTVVDKAVKSVAGVKEHTATKNAKTFDVTGDFNDKEVFEALQKAGLTGKVAK